MTSRSIFGGSTNVAFAAGVTAFLFLGSGGLVQQPLIAQAERIVRGTSSIDTAVLVISANSLSGNATIALMRNGSPALDQNGNPIQFTVTPGQTGPKFNIGNIANYADGDRLCAMVVTDAGTGSVTIRVLTFCNTPTSGLTALYGKDGVLTFNTASTTRFGAIAGSLTTTATDKSRQVIFDVPGTIRNIQTFVLSNTRTTQSTVAIRQNDTITSVAALIDGGVTGLQEGAGSVHIATGDGVDIAYTTGSGSGSLLLAFTAATFDADDGVSYPIFWVSTTSASQAAEFYAPLGSGIATSNAANAAADYVKSGIILSHLRTNITGNTAGEDRAFRTILFPPGGIQKNGKLAAPIPAGTTGVKSDTTNTDQLVSGYGFSVSIDPSATGTVTPIWGSVVLQYIGASRRSRALFI